MGRRRRREGCGRGGNGANVIEDWNSSRFSEGYVEERRGEGEVRLGTVNWKCVYVCEQNALVTQSSIDKQG